MKQFLASARFAAQDPRVLGSKVRFSARFATACWLPPNCLTPRPGKGILYGSQVTALTKDLETTGYALTFGLLDGAYRTYPCYGSR